MTFIDAMTGKETALELPATIVIPSAEHDGENIFFFTRDVSPADNEWPDAVIAYALRQGLLTKGVNDRTARRYHLPGGHDQEGHGNWAEGGGSGAGSADAIDAVIAYALRQGLLTITRTKVKWEDRFPPTNEDPGPGGKYEYHATHANKLGQIVEAGVAGSRSTPISLAPHLRSAHWWGDAIDGGEGDVYLLRVERRALGKITKIIRPPDDDGNDIPDNEETREHQVRASIPADLLEVYYRGKWHKLKDQLKKYHLPGEHDQESHGNWAQGRQEEPHKEKPPEKYPKANKGYTLLHWPSGIDTLTQYTRPDGTLTPERQRLHDDIVAQHLAGHETKAEPVVQLMGGGGASGKSVMQENLHLTSGMLTVDVDRIRTMLPEWKEELDLAAHEGRRPNVMLGSFTHEESSLISKRIISEAVKRDYDYMLDGAGDSTYEKLKANVERYRSGGAKVVANYVTVDYDEAYKRMRERGDGSVYIGSFQSVGRYIPAAHLRAVHAEVARVFPKAIEDGLFDEFTLWDTNGSKPLGGGKFSPALKVVSGKGKNLTIHDQAAWESFLAKGKGIPARRGEK
jgi:hypothetical protein